MNKPVDVLYDEYIESYDPRAMLSKLKKTELIDLSDRELRGEFKEEKVLGRDRLGRR